MPDPRNTFRPFRPARSLWAMIAFLAGFTILITVLAHYFLIPAMEAAQGATPAQKRQLSAYSTLLLAVVLFVLGVGLVLVFRIRRFFFPRATSAPQKTEYVDAWSESARRLEKRPRMDDDQGASAEQT
jgi:hypothetical protein